MRILIADDDVTSRAVLTRLLTTKGHEVVVAVNGTEAWESLRQPDAPALAIIDWLMPEMEGPEVVRRIRALQGSRPPYLIMLTVKDAKADIIGGLEAGANDYLTKPFDSGELHARIAVGQRMLELQETLRKQTEDLLARNVELSRINRVAVNRELRMIELKREVNELCGQLGKPPRHQIAHQSPSPV